MARMIQSHDGWVLRDEWTVDDVQMQARDEWKFELTDDESIRVLQRVAQNYDSDSGITWDAINAAIKALFGTRRRQA
jgi:hypothetical protein